MNHDYFMDFALKQAQNAFMADEVPVGAIIVGPEDEIISQARNQKESDYNPLGHAEIIVIKKAAQKLGRWRLNDCKLYVTLEPCMMCAGAIWQSRIGELIYGAKDPKHGFIYSTHQAFGEDSKLNHKPLITQGPLEKHCSSILSQFFKQKREKKNP